MNEKGQVTIFIIVGLVIIFGVIIYLSARGNIQKSNVLNKDPSQELLNIVQDCLKETGEEVLTTVGEQGGYNIIVEDISSIDGRLPYYIKDKTNLMPSKEIIASHVAGLIQARLPFCVMDFKTYIDNNPDFSINHTLKKVYTSFVKEKVVIKADYLISISKENDTETIKEIKVEIPFNFNEIYRKINKTTQMLLTYSPEICLSCLYELGEQEKMYIELLPYSNSTIVTLIDKDILLNDKEYTWSFAIK